MGLGKTGVTGKNGKSIDWSWSTQGILKAILVDGGATSTDLLTYKQSAVAGDVGYTRISRRPVSR